MHKSEICTEYAVEVASLDLGETINVNHKNCPAGPDNKARLYITRPLAEPNAVLAYCHNCQEGSKFTDTRSRFRLHSNPLVGTSLQLKIEQLDKLGRHEAKTTYPTIRDISKWPDDAKAWQEMCGLTQELIDIYHIGYSATDNRINLPIWQTINLDKQSSQGIGQYLGTQKRRLTIDGPKYVTSKVSKDTELYTMIVRKEGPLDIVFIVEDLVSGIRIMEVLEPMDGNFGVLVNYGVAVQPTVLLKIPETRHIIVWLDNDNDHVKTQAENMKRTLQLLHPKATVSKSINTDPKKLLKTVADTQLFRTNVRALLE